MRPGEAPVERIHLPPGVAFPKGDIDERKQWLAQHADTDVILLYRDGMRIYVRASDGTRGLVLMHELELMDGGSA